jgi:2-oxo-3-hexenedioate decarboxylase
MTAPEDTVSALARRLDDAAQTRTDTPSLADEYTIDIDEAYRIQNELLERRTSRGESIVGIKLGFTSQAKMAQMGVSEVIVGQLTDAMCVSNGGEVDLRKFIHPKIEPEVAYRLSKGRRSRRSERRHRNLRRCTGSRNGDHRLALSRLPLHLHRRRR